MCVHPTKSLQIEVTCWLIVQPETGDRLQAVPWQTTCDLRPEREIAGTTPAEAANAATLVPAEVIGRRSQQVILPKRALAAVEAVERRDLLGGLIHEYHPAAA
jgi:hypothetical protein